MAIHSFELRFSTAGNTDVIDITAEVARLVSEAGVTDGHVLAFVRGSTAAIATMEFEPGGVHDLRELLERVIPTHGDYGTTGSTTTPTRTRTSARRSWAPPKWCRSSTAGSCSAPGSSWS
jgi:thiamine phosphate synthase YjbQ (UPF0047 family)